MFVDHLLRRREHEAAGEVIQAFDEARPRDPLMDELHSTWLWCMGRRRAAASFALKSARYWRVPYLVHKVGTIHRAIYDRTGSAHHQKKARHYWHQAHVLVKQEEAAKARKAASPSQQQLPNG
jgi:hypothetical protein